MAFFERGFADGTQLFEVEGFVDEVEGAAFERGDGGVHVAVRGNHAHRGAGVVFLYVGEEVEAVAVGQADVGDDEAVAVFFECLDGGFDGVNAGAGDVLPHQAHFDEFADVAFVVKD